MEEKYALISVSDKTGIIEIAKKISETHKIIASSGTAKELKSASINVIEVSDYTNQPELLGGMIKTLHPKIYAGILNRNIPDDSISMKEMNAGDIDIVVCNLYDFGDAAINSSRGRKNMEQIDIGGHSLIRAAAKNFDQVTVIVDPDDYVDLIPKLPNVEMQDRITLAAKAFNLMANYDIEISKHMNKIAEVSTSFFHDVFSKNYFLSGSLGLKLRYGENPHQSASYYYSDEIPLFKYISGPKISYNNILDINSGWDLVSEFNDPSCVIIKHRTPCGVASAKDLVSAFNDALDTDEVSAYGGAYVFNQSVDQKTANELIKVFADVVFAPGYDEGVIEILKQKDHLTIVNKSPRPERRRDISLVAGGFVIQERDMNKLESDQLEFASIEQPSENEIELLKFAYSVVKNAQSNAIVVSSGTKTVGLSSGQTSRISAVKQALADAGDKSKGAIMASDAFFPFPDSIKAAAEAGISLIITPSGSKNDQEIIEEANSHKIKLVFSHRRALRH